MLDFSAASQIPMQKVLVAEDSFDFSFEDSSEEESLSSLKQPRCAYLLGAKPDSPLEDSIGSEADLDPDSPRKSINVPSIMMLPFGSPTDKSTLFTEVTPEETRHNWCFSSTKANHNEGRKLDDSLDIVDFAKGIEPDYHFYPAPSCSETRDELFVQEHSLEDSIELTLKCADILSKTKKSLAAGRITRAARMFLYNQRKKKAAEKFKNLFDEAFKKKLQEFQARKAAHERKLKQRTKLKAVVKGWRTRRILKKSPAIRHIKDKLRTAMPFAAKRLRAKLIEVFEKEQSQGMQLRRKVAPKIIATRRNTLSKKPSESIKTSGSLRFLNASKPQSKNPTKTTPVTPKNKPEPLKHRRQSSLDEFCMLEALTKKESYQTQDKPELPVALRPSHKVQCPKYRQKTLAPRNLPKTHVRRRSLSKLPAKPEKLQDTLEAARRLLSCGSLKAIEAK
mmetsp:Transcript_3274/g.6751  ORF Transcript_3274/g.6751 Transcript_3274/m.6751 type:complete len:450 (-) Transcript_3274:33-1382(-)